MTSTSAGQRFLTLLISISSATVAVAQQSGAGPSVNVTIWAVPLAQRQALLASQVQQAQQTQQLLIDLRAQIQAASITEQQAQMERQQAATRDLVAQQKASAAIQEASNNAWSNGYDRAASDAEAKMQPKRVDMAVAAAQTWTPPKPYGPASSGTVVLADPFSPASAKASTDQADQLNSLQASIQGTCLTLDAQHGVAMVERDCGVAGHKLPFRHGDYPLLADGSLLDTAQRVRTFVEICADETAHLYGLRNESQMVVLR
jgi:hypothetical protein